MNTVYFPSHKDSGNRGCEAIARATCKILHLPKGRAVLFSNNRETDMSCGLGAIAQVWELPSMGVTTPKNFLLKVKRKLLSAADGRRWLVEYEKYLQKIDENDLVLSTGGDLLCYGENEVPAINNTLSARGVKTVLWGCSVGEENLTAAKVDTLRRYSLITPRETLSENVLKSIGVQRIERYPDPAFVLEPKPCALPACFSQGDVVGINLSPFVWRSSSPDTVFDKALAKFLEDLLAHTDFRVLLLPHVLWPAQDDRVPSRQVYDRFRESGRIEVLDTENRSYCEIRHVISKCRFFIGARTHSVISAYATQVPALALGYSIKAIGIAKDLGLDDALVLDCTNMQQEDSLLHAFHHLMKQEAATKQHLQDVMPGYISKAFEAADAVNEWINPS